MNAFILKNEEYGTNDAFILSESITRDELQHIIQELRVEAVRSETSFSTTYIAEHLPPSCALYDDTCDYPLLLY